MPSVMEGVKDNLQSLAELDLSKLNINSIACFREIAEILMLNKNMKSLTMVRANINDD